MSEQKHVVITGANGGIGQELVKQFLEQGHKVYALSRSDQFMTNMPPTDNLVYINTDFNEEGWEHQVSNHLKDVTIDYLINNAGFLVNRPFKETSLRDMVQTIHINMLAPAMLIQTLINQMASPSHIINITSMAGFQGSDKFPGLSIYSASKCALNCLTESLAKELPEHVTINALALGATQTEMLEKAFPGIQAPVQPSEMAVFITQFAKNAVGILTGQVVPVTLSSPK